MLVAQSHCTHTLPSSFLCTNAPVANEPCPLVSKSTFRIQYSGLSLSSWRREGAPAPLRFSDARGVEWSVIRPCRPPNLYTVGKVSLYTVGKVTRETFPTVYRLGGSARPDDAPRASENRRCASAPCCRHLKDKEVRRFIASAALRGSGLVARGLLT